MKNIRTDLIVISIILSVVAHFGIMYYAKPLVMTHVVKGVNYHTRRGPMKVSEAKDIPPPVKIETIKDIDPDKNAPDADEALKLAPKLGSAVEADNVELTVPEVAMPEISASEIPVEKLPELLTSAFSPVAAPEVKMITDSHVPTEPEQIVHMPLPSVTDFVAAPKIGVPEISVGDVPIDSAEATAMKELGKDDRNAKKPVPTFVPAPEVMDKVNESFVADEKAAVKRLIDSPDAFNLSDAVAVSLSRTMTSDGGDYFRVTVRPKTDDLKPVPKDVVILIDASMSIGRDRMTSIRAAAKRILRSSANTGDRFNLVAFRDKFSYAFTTWQECNVQSFAKADQWLNGVAPFGRTDVFKTIRSILTLPRDPTRPLIALVVTDGDANAGVSDTAKILSRFSRLNDGLVSVYMYGVKSSANRELIEVLTQGNRGESFIFDEEGWGSSQRAGTFIPQLSNKFRDPILTDIRVVFASDCPATAYPRMIKNLYSGGSIEFVGRVPKGAKEISFSLKGLNGKDAYESFFRLPLEDAAFDPTLHKVWAQANEVDLKLR